MDRQRDVLHQPGPATMSAERKRRLEELAESIVMSLDSRRSRRRQPAPAPRWRRLAEYFVARWEQAVLERPELREVRCLETLNHCRTYIQAHFELRTEAEVRRHIDRFVAAVASGELAIKPGQSAWMRFTGAWGR